MPVTNYIWDVEHDCCLAETDENGETTVVYNNRPVQFGRLLSQRRGGATSYHKYDAQHSTRMLTDESGNITDTYTYTAFGEPVATTGTTVNPFRWAGELGYYWDAELNTYHVRRRRYSPRLALWVSRDILLRAHAYRYVHNTPIVWFDPAGTFDVQDVIDAINDYAQPGTFEFDFPLLIGGIPLAAFASLTIEKDPKDPTCRVFTLAGGLSITAENFVKRIPPLKKLMDSLLADNSAIALVIMDLGSVQAFFETAGRVCCDCIEFPCEVALSGAFTLGSGRRGAPDQTKPITQVASTSKLEFGLGVVGELHGVLNFCVGTINVDYTGVLDISIAIPGPGGGEWSFNRDFIFGGSLIEGGPFDSLIWTDREPCR